MLLLLAKVRRGIKEGKSLDWWISSINGHMSHLVRARFLLPSPDSGGIEGYIVTGAPATKVIESRLEGAHRLSELE